VKFKKIKVAFTAFASWSVIFASAQTTTAEPESSITYNAGFVTDYRYRGVSRSAHKPAFQFGEDFADKSGFYAGNWNSTISWIKDSADSSSTSSQSARGPLEMDFYAGYKGSISESMGFDVGLMDYVYPTSNLGGVSNKYNGVSGNFSNAATTEIYGAFNIGAFEIKYFDSITNLFGYTNSKNSMYVDLSYSFYLGDGYSSVVHYGNQRMKVSNAAQVTSGVTDYNDYSLSLNKDYDGIVVSATAVATDWSKRGSQSNFVLPGSGTTNLAGASLVLGLKKNF